MTEDNNWSAVGPLALGCAQLGLYDMGPTDLSAVKSAVRLAFDSGITAFDTADVYGLGRAESELANALGAHRHEAFIVTKYGVRWEKSSNGQRARTFLDGSPQYAVKALEASLGRLRIDAIPLYLVHWPDTKVAMEDTIAVLDEQKKKGKILNYGLSNSGYPDIRRATEIGQIVAVQGSLSLLKREKDIEFYSHIKRLGLGVFVYGVLAQGLLSGKYGRESRFSKQDRRSRLPSKSSNWHENELVIAALSTIATRRCVSVVEVAIRWVLDQGVVDVAVVGVKSVEQVKVLLSSLNWKLSLGDLELLDQVRKSASQSYSGSNGE